MVTGLKAGQWRYWIVILGMARDFIFFIVSRPALQPIQPPIQWVWGPLLKSKKRVGQVANHSPPSSAKVKSTWSFTSTYSIYLHGMVLNLAPI